MIRKSIATATAALTVLGALLVGTSSASAAAAPPQPQVYCGTAPPGSSYYLDSTWSTCGECLREGSALEATGNYRAYCRQLLGIYWLYLFCVVCRTEGADAVPAGRFHADAEAFAGVPAA